MIELKENAIRYFVDNLVFSVVIDTDNDVSFHIYDKNIMEYIYSYIIDDDIDDLQTYKNKEAYLKAILITNVCNYYNKQRMKFLEDMDLFSEEVDKNE